MPLHYPISGNPNSFPKAVGLVVVLCGAPSAREGRSSPRLVGGLLKTRKPTCNGSPAVYMQGVLPRTATKDDDDVDPTTTHMEHRRDRRSTSTTWQRIFPKLLGSRCAMPGAYAGASGWRRSAALVEETPPGVFEPRAVVTSSGRQGKAPPQLRVAVPGRNYYTVLFSNG